MSFKITMPQLGMNQDSAIIVRWLKSEGDEIKKGEALFEVETDKATMEVEAQGQGFLSNITARAGSEIPVGDQIAELVSTAADVTQGNAAPKEDAPQKSQPQEEAKTPEPAPQSAPTAKSPAPPSAAAQGKILASPKAKRIAREEGLDLASLRAQGVTEPFHVKDLTHAARGGTSLAQISASAPTEALEALLQKSHHTSRTALLQAMAARAWQQVFEVDPLTVIICYGDAAGQESQTTPDAPAHVLHLYDFCATHITAYRASGHGLSLSIGQEPTRFTLELSYDQTVLNFEGALAFIEELASRIEDPIRQLL